MGEPQPGPSGVIKFSSPMKKRPKRTPLTSKDKHTVINVYKYVEETFLKLRDTYPVQKDIVEKCAEITGTSQATVYRILKERRVTGRVESPPVRKPKRTFIDSIDDLELGAIRRKVHQFYFNNEPPTINKVLEAVNADDSLGSYKRTTFHKVLLKLQFKYSKRCRKSILIDRDEIVLWRVKYLSQITKLRNEGKKIYYTDETWLNEGYKIPQIENMGATLDQFDTIDFSDNDVRKLDGFPLLKRLHCLLLNNNRIVRIGENLEQYLPNLESLILTNNNIQELGDLDPLTSLTKLRTLSLMHNPVANKQHYRAYVAFKFPELRLLDFRKIKQKERDEANTLFKSKKGKELQKEITKKSKTFVPGGNIPDPKVSNLTPQEIHKIRDAIKNASSLQEVERLTRMLQSGQIPGQKPLMQPTQTNGQRNDEEEMETDLGNE